MADWAEEKALEIVDGCTERRKMTLPSGREADVVVAIHPTADKIAAALREADKRAREECRRDYDGLEADLASALGVLWRRGDEGGRDFIRRNYPGFDPDQPCETIRSTIKEAQHD